MIARVMSAPTLSWPLKRMRFASLSKLKVLGLPISWKSTLKTSGTLSS